MKILLENKGLYISFSKSSSMRVLIFLLVAVLFITACTTTEVVDKVVPFVPSDAQLSSCSLDTDCVPLPSQCHPTRCINKDFITAYETPQVCTEIFLVEAAYIPEDCICMNSICTNKNKIIDSVDLPAGATKCNFRGEVCTMKNQPVCGWFKESVQCIKAPCAIDASNPCEACANENVAYWIEGECDET